MGSAEGARSFTAGGDAYDAFMGGDAVLLAPHMADLAGVTEGQRALDVGCGTGALTAELVRRLGAENVAGCDPSPSQLESCRAKLPDVELHEAPAEALPYPDATFDVALAQLVMHFTTDPERAAAEMRRVVTPGGRVAACVWDFEGGMQMLRAFWDAALTVDPWSPDELLAMPFGRAGELAALFAGAGLTDLHEAELTVERGYDDFEQLWSTLLLGVGPAGAHLMSLPAEKQEAMRAAYLDRLGRPSGSFTLTSVARAVVGTVPS